MDAVKIFLDYVGYFFTIYLIGYASILFFSVAIGSTVLYNNRKYEKFKNDLKHEYYVPISIVVPAHDEDVTIIGTVKSLLNIDYKIYEIIVIDDGSKDDTSKKLIEYFNMHKINRPINKQVKCKLEKEIYIAYINNIPVTLVIKENGGKADALNMGINVSKYPYFLCMDADSKLQHDSLNKIAKPLLEDDTIVACGGMVGLSNGIEFENGYVKKYKMPKNLLVCMQILEYDRSFLASRILLDQINGNLIISGAFGLFKKDMAIAVGGYDTATVGEDMELVVKLHVFCISHNIKYSIRYASDAICWSQAPNNMRDLINQRSRWYIGLFQTMIKYKTLFINYNYGLVSFVSFLYFLLYELLSPFIEIFGLFTILLSIILNLINYDFMIMFFLVYGVFGAVLSLAAFFSRCHTQNYKITPSDILKAIFLCLFEVTVLRFIMSFTRMKALFKYNKRKNHWGKIKRFKH